MLSQVPTTHCMARTTHHRRASLLGLGSSPVSGPIFCGTVTAAGTAPARAAGQEGRFSLSASPRALDFG
jgi:hypothetical protein